MITLETVGASALLAEMRRRTAGHRLEDEELASLVDANAFFVDFYSQWSGSSRTHVAAAIRDYDLPDKVPEGLVPQRLAEGFRQAVCDLSVMEQRLASLRQVDLSSVADKVLRYLPQSTPLDSMIHLTVDDINNAFAYKGEMGVSLLKGAGNEEAFREVVGHELHHVGFAHWASKDKVRQRFLGEEAPRAIAVRHVQNLLMEGLANYYLTPGYAFPSTATQQQSDAFQARLSRLQREEGAFLARANELLVMCLSGSVEAKACHAAYQTIAMDMEDFMLPAGHYLGARMVQTMDGVCPREGILDCVQHLARFLPMYNEAARKQGAYVFDEQAVEQFAALWHEEG